jgi:SulP family sulfate permease
VTRRVPAPLVALSLAALAAAALAQLVPGFSLATIASTFAGGIPQSPPQPTLPWLMPGPDGRPLLLTLDLFRALAPSAFAIAMLGAIESLLCAVVADGMAATRHDPDGELLAQGLGNLVVPFFGGVAATGAIARTATNIRAGARSPVAAFVHALFVLAAVLLLAPWLAWLPMASLAALLLVVAWNMSEARHFLRIVRVAPKSDTTVLLTCFTLTVVFDMVVAVSVGIVLAALLFMRRMAEIAHVRLAQGGHHLYKDVPPDVILYEIGGPLFFGAADKAVSALQRTPVKARAVILDLEDVPAMDVTGLIALESSLQKLRRLGLFVVITGLRPQPAEVLKKAGIREEEGRLALRGTVPEALELLGPARASSPGGPGHPALPVSP